MSLPELSRHDRALARDLDGLHRFGIDEHDITHLDDAGLLETWGALLAHGCVAIERTAGGSPVALWLTKAGESFVRTGITKARQR